MEGKGESTRCQFSPVVLLKYKEAATYRDSLVTYMGAKTMFWVTSGAYLGAP
jgi:hypothetical protein